MKSKDEVNELASDSYFEAKEIAFEYCARIIHPDHADATNLLVSFAFQCGRNSAFLEVTV